MGEFFNSLRQRFIEFYNSLDNRMKWVYGLVSVFLVLGITVGIILAVRPHYVVLMRGVSLEDAGAITEKLDEESIPWKQENNNSTILVPDKERDKALMKLAVGGFPNTGEITWEEVMKTTSITMTNEEKNKYFLQAQITALRNAIRQLDGVVDANVSLVVSQESAFVLENDSEARASVILSLKSGYKLKEEQVNGIVMILVNSVKGLKKENVTIVDSTGMQLNKTDTDTDNFQASTQYELTQAIQDGTKSRLKEFLATIYGEKNVEVGVNLSLDFDSQTQEIIEFKPPIEGNEDGLVRSMTELSETVVNGQSGGAPGTDSNTDVTNYPASDTGQSEYRKANKTLNYELNQIKTNIDKAKGQIKDLSIAVIVNKKAIVGNELSDVQKAELVNLVSAAGGIDTKLIQVSAQEFAEKETVTIAPTTSGIPVWVWGIVAALVLAGIVGTALVMRKTKEKAVEEEQRIIEEEELEEIDLEFRDKSSPKYQIEKYIDAKPEAVAALLRSWLNDE